MLKLLRPLQHDVRFSVIRRFNSTHELKARAVVSSFIFKAKQNPHSIPEFALFKRSLEVNSYPGKWAVCSGSIEPTDESPKAAAKREIKEETTLTDADLSLLRKGKPFSLVDEELKTRWTIHPFAWQLKQGAKPIKFDWEHTEYKFIKPADLSKFDHVPQLEIGLNRLLISHETEANLETLRSSPLPAPQLSVLALALIEASLQNGDLRRVSSTSHSGLNSSSDFSREMGWKVWHFVENGRPEMKDAMKAVLVRSLKKLNADVESLASVNSKSKGTRRPGGVWRYADEIPSRTGAAEMTAEELEDSWQRIMLKL